MLEKFTTPLALGWSELLASTVETHPIRAVVPNHSKQDHVGLECSPSSLLATKSIKEVVLLQEASPCFHEGKCGQMEPSQKSPPRRLLKSKPFAVEGFARKLGGSGAILPIIGLLINQV